MTSPLNCLTRLPYSPSGSQIMTSSSVVRIAFAISRFAENDLPEPGVPKIKPFGFLSIFLSAIIRLWLKAFNP